MCGIIYVKRRDGKPAVRSVLKRYRAQKTRGQDGYGYVAVKDDKVVAYHRTATEKEIVEALEKEDAPEILFHHRMPTSTPNVPEAAHPILVSNPERLDHNYLIVHNGVITNAEELKEEHVKDGYKYNTSLAEYVQALTGKAYITGYSFNDSESIAIETAEVLDGRKRWNSARGAAAIVGFQLDEQGNVTSRFFYRNEGNPLKIQNDQVMFALTSEGGGEMLPSDRVKHLSETGVVENFPGEYYTPYRYSAEYKSHSWPDYSRHEEDERLAPGMTSRQGSMGFHSQEDDEPEDIQFDAEEDASHAFEFDAEHFTNVHVRSIGDILKFKGFIMRQTTDEVWRLYDKFVDKDDDLNQKIREFDALVENNSSIDRVTFEERAEMQAQSDRLSKYVQMLSDELTVRASLEKTLELAPGDESVAPVNGS